MQLVDIERFIAPPFSCDIGHSQWLIDPLPQPLKGTNFPQLFFKTIPPVLEELHPYLKRASYQLTYPAQITISTPNNSRLPILAYHRLDKYPYQQAIMAIFICTNDLLKTIKDHEDIALATIFFLLHEIFEANHSIISKQSHNYIQKKKPDELGYEKEEYEVYADTNTARIMQIILNANLEWNDSGCLAGIQIPSFSDQ